MNYISWKNNKIPIIVMGTAQFGSNYGIANKIGKPPFKIVEKIVNKAIDLGINCFDTSPVYGDSEETLGKILHKKDVKIISKIPFYIDPLDATSIEQVVVNSCKNLCVDQLWCLMIHDELWINKWSGGLSDILFDIKKKGLVKHIGISCYDLVKLCQAAQINMIEIMQFPCNVMDQRFIRSYTSNYMKYMDKLCLIRSIYLQGLLLLGVDEIRKKFPIATQMSLRWKELSEEIGIDKKRLALFFALSIGQPLIIGMETVEQLIDNVSIIDCGALPKDIVKYIYQYMLPFVNEQIWNPKLWNIKR